MKQEFEQQLNEILRSPNLREEVSELLNALHVSYEDLRAFKHKVEEMQKIIDIAVIFLQSNELHIRAAQIKVMVQSLKEVTEKP